MESQSVPSNRTRPASANSRPPKIRSSVVFPDPEGPSSARKQPLGAVKLTPFSAGKRSKRLATDSTTSDICCLLVSMHGGNFVRVAPFKKCLEDQSDQRKKRK